MEVNIQRGPVKVVVADFLHVINLRDCRIPEPRKILKIEKMLPVINPQPKASGRDIEHFNARNDGASVL